MSAAGKKSKRKGGEAASVPPPPLPQVALYSDDHTTTPVPASTDNATAWVTGGILVIDSQRFIIEVNPPTVTALTLPARPLTGFPLLPVADLQYGSMADCAWTWQRCPHGAAVSDISGTVVSCERAYVPSDEDAGLQLRVTCVPGRTQGGLDSGDAELLTGESLSVLTGVLLVCIVRAGLPALLVTLLAR
jgi:hypothetical protein